MDIQRNSGELTDADVLAVLAAIFDLTVISLLIITFWVLGGLLVVEYKRYRQRRTRKSKAVAIMNAKKPTPATATSTAAVEIPPNEVDSPDLDQDWVPVEEHQNLTTAVDESSPTQHSGSKALNEMATQSQASVSQNMFSLQKSQADSLDLMPTQEPSSKKRAASNKTKAKHQQEKSGYYDATFIPGFTSARL
ncbi:unnamed protein product, partial [Mesorhabditis spiculigera]